MKKYFAQMFATILLGALFVSCSSKQTVNTPSNTENLPTPSKESTLTQASTSTITPATFTLTPTIEPTSTPSPLPATLERATIKAFGPVCGSTNIYGSEISPGGKWVAVICQSENGTEDSPLEIISTDHSKNWKMYYRDFFKGNSGYDHHDSLIPYRWSKDGRFLYAFSGARLSGCCWVGGRNTLLVRLNLETGEQVEFLNATDYTFLFDFIISDSDNYLIFAPLTNQSNDLIIWDLQTGKTRTITLQFEYPIDLYYAIISPNEEKIIVQLFKFYDADRDFKLDAIALIDLKTHEQKVLISGLSLKEEELYPVRWLDNSQVLLNTVAPDYRDYPAYSAEEWIININTGELVKSEKP